MLEVVELDGARVVEGLVDPVVVDSVFAIEGVPVCEHEGDLREDDVVGGVVHAVEVLLQLSVRHLMIFEGDRLTLARWKNTLWYSAMDPYGLLRSRALEMN